MKQLKQALGVLLTCLLALSSPGRAASPPVVVADIAPVQSLVAMVTGDIAAPAALVPAGADPHHLQLRPSQRRLLGQADVIIMVGDQLTPWLADVLERSAPDALVLQLLRLPGTTRRQAGSAAADPGDDMATDPHAWLDLRNARLWLGKIAETLATADPGNAARYRANARAGVARLERLDSRMAARLAPLAGMGVGITHDALRYLAGRYGIDIVASLSPPEGTPPRPSALRKLRLALAEGTAQCLLVMPEDSPALIARLTEGLNVPVARIDPLGVGLPRGADLYEDMLLAISARLSACRAAR